MSQDILLCVRVGIDKTPIENLLRKSFPNDNFIPFDINPNNLEKLVDQQKYRIPWNTPAVFFCTCSKLDGGRIDCIESWLPLFERCKAIAIISLVNTQQDFDSQVSIDHKNWWGVGLSALKDDEKLNTIPYVIVSIGQDQTELSPQQRADLLSIAESKDKKWNKTIKNGLMFGIGACLLGIFGWLFKKIFLNPQKA